MRLRRPKTTTTPTTTTTVPTRAARLAAPAAALVVASLALGGCSELQKQSSAAIVDGRVISDADVAQATQEYNDHIAASAQERAPENRVLSLLILAPFVLEQVQSSGSWKPDDAYNTIMAKVPNASPGTVQVVKTMQAGRSFTPADVSAIVARLKAAKIELDPRYGTFDPTTGGTNPTVNNWIKPAPAPTAAQTGP